MNKAVFQILFLFLVLFIISCAQEETPSEQSPGIITNEESVVQQPFKPYSTDDEGNYEFECTEQQQSRVNTFGGNVHTIWSATSEDGSTWTKEQYIQPGSVPEVILFNDKYYLFAMGSCLMYVSDDGLNFEPYTYTLKNKNIPDDFKNFGGVDPTALEDDGKIRLFFYEPDFQGGQPSDPALVAGEHSIVQYVSEDAITWTRVGEAVAVEQITDPDAVLYNDLYYLFLSKGTSVIATSSEDGETFSVLNNGAAVHSLGGVPDTIVIDEILYMYAHKYSGTGMVINIMTSTDGLSWEAAGTALEEAESPSIVQLSDGSYRMYYVKSMSEKEYEEMIAK
jgi:hypothetical protein